MKMVVWDWNGTLLDDVEVCIETRNFDHFNNVSVWRLTNKIHAVCNQSFTVVIVYFITMTVTFGNLLCAIQFI